MKSKIYSIKGEETGEIALPEIFNTKIREDIVQKYYEVEKLNNIYPYAPYKEAGKRHAASGKISHKRHDWKGHYGKGMSRIPRKTMWRRGTQFFWVGAEIASTRGGRRAHPPKAVIDLKKINKKEMIKAMLSSLSYISNKNEVKNKYNSLDKISIELPLIVEDKIVNLKAKKFFESLNKILGDLYRIAIQKKTIRAGKGKMRGKKYKKNAGLLFVIPNNEDLNITGIDIVKANDLRVSDLASSGARLTLFSETALDELENIFKEKNEKKVVEDKNEIRFDRRKNKNEIRNKKMKNTQIKEDKK